MSSRFRDVDAAFKWGIPLHLWDRTGTMPTDEQKAEMAAYIRARSKMESWEAWLQRPKDSKGIVLDGNKTQATEKG